MQPTPSRHWGISLLVVIGLGVSSAWAAEPVVVGQPAPITGVVIPEEKAGALVEEIRAARQALERIRALTDVTVAQAAQIEGLMAQAAALESANARLEAVVRLAEEMEALRQKQRDVAQMVFERYDRALTQADAALAKAESRINALEQRALWSQVLSVLGPIALLVLLAF